jgi:hypothetical protein
MEGRIQAFPREQWEQEFPRAAAAGLSAIEWIYDTYGVGANPLETAEGVARMVALVARPPRGNPLGLRRLLHGFRLRSRDRC